MNKKKTKKNKFIHLGKSVDCDAWKGRRPLRREQLDDDRKIEKEDIYLFFGSYRVDWIHTLTQSSVHSVVVVVATTTDDDSVAVAAVT